MEHREKSHSSEGVAVVRIWAEFAAPVLTKMYKAIFYFFETLCGGSRVYGKLLQLTCYRDTDLSP